MTKNLYGLDLIIEQNFKHDVEGCLYQ